jgi:DNA-binding NarL/FixJ family response regulator
MTGLSVLTETTPYPKPVAGSVGVARPTPLQKPDPIRVVVADAQAQVRAGFRQILDADRGITVVGEASDGKSAVHTVEVLRPDVLVVDIRMPGADGLEVCRRLDQARRQGRLTTEVVVATSFDLEEYLIRALTHGAAGFLLKRSRPELLVEAVRAAVAGGTLVSSQLAIRLLTGRGGRRRDDHDSQVGMLTARELDVTREVSRGRTNAQVATILSITARTVETHLANIKSKLSVSNRVEVAAWAWAHGVVGPGPTWRCPAT